VFQHNQRVKPRARHGIQETWLNTERMKVPGRGFCMRPREHVIQTGARQLKAVGKELPGENR
jgi:hypothetical protein